MVRDKAAIDAQALRIVERALGFDGIARSEFVRITCGADAMLKARVDALLAGDDGWGAAGSDGPDVIDRIGGALRSKYARLARPR